MKKLLLSIFMMVVAIGLANATETTFNFTDPTSLGYAVPAKGAGTNLADGEMISGNIKIVSKKVNSNDNRFWGNTNGTVELRTYSGNSFTITVSDSEMITGISFAGTTVTSAVMGTFSSGVYDGTTKQWTGNASTLTITFGGTAKLNTMVVTTASSSATVATPVITPAGADVSTPQTVTITCETAGASIHYTLDGTAPSASSTTYTAPFEVTETTTVKAIAVKGSDVSSIATATFLFPTSIATIADFYALGTSAGGQYIKFSCPFTVTYFGLANGTSTGRYLYVKDATGAAMQIYATTDFGTFANGDVIPAGLEGTVSVYGGQLQFNPDASSFGEITKGATVEPTVITVADANANSYLAHYVKFENVTFDTATKKIVSGEDMINYYIRFADATAVPTDGKAYDMVGIYTIYNGTKQIFPISFTESAGTGIENVEAADVVSTEYYSVLGQKLNAAEAGLNIVKETLSNGKVVVRKVMVK